MGLKYYFVTWQKINMLPVLDSHACGVRNLCCMAILALRGCRLCKQAKLQYKHIEPIQVKHDQSHRRLCRHWQHVLLNGAAVGCAACCCSRQLTVIFAGRGERHFAKPSTPLLKLIIAIKKTTANLRYWTLICKWVKCLPKLEIRYRAGLLLADFATSLWSWVPRSLRVPKIRRQNPARYLS